MKEINLIDNFFKDKNGFEAAILCSFNLNLQFFEQFLLKLDTLYTCRNISLFIDNNIYNDLINEPFKPRYLNKNYLVTSITAKGSFHPKIYIATSEKKASLAIGSANISMDGMARNLEILSCFEISEENQEHSHIFITVLDYLQKLAEISRSKKAIGQFNKFKDICHPLIQKTKKNSFEFLHNLDQSFTEIIKEKTKGHKVNKISIISPFFDQNLAPLQEFKKMYPKIPVNIYIQSGKSTFPVNQYDKIKKDTNIMLYKNIERYMHGKAIIINSNRGSFLFSGSANFSYPALCSKASTGNYEIALFGIINEKIEKKLLSPQNNKAYKVKHASEIEIVYNPDEKEKKQLNNSIDYIIEAEVIKDYIEVIINKDISKDFFKPIKFRLHDYQGKAIEKKITDNFKIKIDTQLKKILEFSPRIQIIGYDKDNNEIESNFVWVITLDEDKENIYLSKCRKVYNNPFELINVLTDIITTNGDEELQSFLASFDIPLDLIIFRSIMRTPGKWESSGNIKGELPSEVIFFKPENNKETFNLAFERLEDLFYKLEVHYETPQFAKFDNFMRIICSVYSLLEFLNNRIYYKYYKLSIIDYNEWSTIRYQYNKIVQFLELLWNLFFKTDGYQNLITEEIIKEFEDNDDLAIYDFESFIKNTDYYNDIMQIISISFRIIKSFKKIKETLQIQNNLGDIVPTNLFSSDNYLKDIDNINKKYDSLLNKFFLHIKL